MIFQIFQKSHFLLTPFRSTLLAEDRIFRQNSKWTFRFEFKRSINCHMLNSLGQYFPKTLHPNGRSIPCEVKKNKNVGEGSTASFLLERGKIPGLAISFNVRQTKILQCYENAHLRNDLYSKSLILGWIPIFLGIIELKNADVTKKNWCLKWNQPQKYFQHQSFTFWPIWRNLFVNHVSSKRFWFEKLELSRDLAVCVIMCLFYISGPSE